MRAASFCGIPLTACNYVVYKFREEVGTTVKIHGFKVKKERRRT
jgi:hypothetical protein